MGALAKHFEKENELHEEKMRYYLEKQQEDSEATERPETIKEKRIHKIETCKRCGKQFVISIGSALFFTKNKLQMPTHCPECRKKRKKETEEQRRKEREGKYFVY